MRRPIIAGNWKMHKVMGEAVALAEGVKRQLQAIEDMDVVLCPPFTALAAVSEALRGSTIHIGAQDVHWEPEGAYTGAVSGKLVKDAGAHFVIIGHSERRSYFSETNESVNKKVKAALEWELVPMMCVGEKLQEREKGSTFDVVRDHIENGLRGLTRDQMTDIVIAYEPVWAIGTGITATPEQAQEVHAFIRTLLSDLFDGEIASAVRIQYGGSVNPDNIRDLMNQEDIDGALVGGASLKIESFVGIVKNVK